MTRRDRVMEHVADQAEILDRLSGVKTRGAGWIACCPAHDDHRASLSIGRGDDGRCWLLKCHAGCGLDAILAAMHLERRDLFPRTDTRQRAEIVAEYDYTDEQDVLLYQSIRLAPKDFRQRRPDGRGGWDWSVSGVRRVLYRLHALPRQKTVFIVEGEKDADRLAELGLTATTNAGGAGKWRDAYTEQLTAAGIQQVIVIPDNDDAGIKHARAVAADCHAAGIKTKLLTLPVAAKGDVSDYLADHGQDDLFALVKAAPLHAPEAANLASSATKAPVSTRLSSVKKESQATAMVRLALEAGAELWHTPTGDGYITIAVGGHHEHHPLASRGTRDYLTRLFYLDTGKAPNLPALQAAIATLNGIARFDGEEHDVHVRVAGGDDDHVYLDLGDSAWRAVEVTLAGWRIISEPPVRFRRPRGMLPLPVPVGGGSIEELRSFVNVATDKDFVLVVAWVLAALRPRGPYPIQVFMAEQGAAKTTATRVQQRLTDPNESDVRRPPRNTEDLMIAATNGHVVPFDNLSRLPQDLSDNLSVLATGGGFAVRKLYMNREEEIFHAQRSIILNGDLTDRDAR